MTPKPYTDLTEVELLSLCEWREADDQGEEGMRGVGHVVMNRVKKPSWWGVSVATVILKPWQFSSFDHGDPDEKRWPEDDNMQWRQAQTIAIGLLAGTDVDTTGGATSYYDLSMDPPSWTASMVFTVQIGSQRFYRLPDALYREGFVAVDRGNSPMKMYCQNPDCVFECADDREIEDYAVIGCPLCGCMTFAAQKPVTTFPAMSSMAAAAAGLINRNRENTIKEHEVLERVGFNKEDE